MTNIENLLDGLPRLKQLDLHTSCMAFWYARHRQIFRYEAPPWATMDKCQSAAFKLRYPRLVVRYEFYMRSYFYIPYDGGGGVIEARNFESCLSLPRSVIFKASRTGSPYAWEGPDLEQVRIC